LYCLQAFIEKFPQFAEKGQRGEPLQHDAEECWTLLTRLFEETLPKTNTEASLVDSYLKGEFTVRYENTECIKEVQSATSKFLFLKCLINNEVNHLEKGISLALRGTLEKKSAYLDRSCVFSYNSEISRLPGYLCVQFMRFYWKQSKAKKVKVVRNVKFPIELDLFEFCSADLREKLKEMRFKIKEFDDVVSKTKSSSQNNNKTPSLEYFPFSFETDPGSNNSGKYTLRAVLTHKGMYADGGHYVSWIRQALSDSWILYDDEKVSFKKQEDILKLSGGGYFDNFPFFLSVTIYLVFLFFLAVNTIAPISCSTLP
jgi:ubiquitin carboxyl-terminal hydrolase 14